MTGDSALAAVALLIVIASVLAMFLIWPEASPDRPDDPIEDDWWRGIR